ncbi:hypothetical protein [Cohnella abietis]|uniref:Lipoprotein n=1 Tax=Cohnella abietis TaxID=2507935 RepID=A0A3T1D3P5_9BACL|nr:hypothetical protein [Cohnella abietis]BBI32671.1 hypothetical protein KCTCHS21_20700 [Cohnella abietis]
MKSFLRLTVLVLLITVAVGCSGGSSFKPNTFSSSDMCIVKINNKSKVCYGDSRSQAEKVLGSGTKSPFGYEYDFGVKLAFRDDKIVFLSFDEDAKGVYRTARGAKIGMLNSDVKKLYGNKYSGEDGIYLGYFYDSKDKKFIDEVPPTWTDPNSDIGVNTFVLQAYFDDNGYTDRIMLIDYQYAIKMQ